VASAQFPKISEIRNLVIELLGKTKFPPNDPKLWPLFTFLSKALDEKAPINWLTAPPFAENIATIRQILDFLKSGSKRNLLQIKNPEGKSIPFPMDSKKHILESITSRLMRMPSFPTSEKQIAQALEAIERIEFTLGEDTLFDFRIVPKAEIVERNRKTIKDRLLQLDKEGELLFETQSGNPYGKPVEIAEILDSLTDLVTEALLANSISNLSLIGRLHVTMNDRKAVGIRIQPSHEALSRLIKGMKKQ
jgi:hypothetical protein